MIKLLAACLIPMIFLIESPTISAGELNASPKINAKIARIKAKQRALARKNKANGSSGTGADGCGNVNIGNVQNQRGSSNQEVTVVVTGDVISVGNNCR